MISSQSVPNFGRKGIQEGDVRISSVEEVRIKAICRTIVTKHI